MRVTPKRLSSRDVVVCFIVGNGALDKFPKTEPEPLQNSDSVTNTSGNKGREIMGKEKLFTEQEQVVCSSIWESLLDDIFVSFKSEGKPFCAYCPKKKKYIVSTKKKKTYKRFRKDAIQKL
jgi:hypothetical protein